MVAIPTVVSNFQHLLVVGMFVRLSGWMAGWLALRRFKVVIQTNAEVFVLRFCFEPSFCLAVI